MKNSLRAPKLVAYGIAAAGLLVSGALAGCSGSLPVASPAQIIPQAQQRQAAIATTSAAVNTGANVDVAASWRDSIVHSSLPSAGCFVATYPSMTWQSTACSTPPHLLYPAISQGSGAQISTDATKVGDGNDYTAQTSGVMSEAIGSFPTVTGVTTVVSTPNPKFGDGCDCGKDSYTLQLNSSFFTSAACNSEKNCSGWEQFVYENPVGSQKGSLFIQDWLVPTNLTGSIKCPAGKGWESADGGCVQNSPSSVSIPNQAIANLGKLVETGEAATSGDSVYLAVGTTVYGMKNIQSNGITDLSSNWTGAEFNVVGNAGGSIARFNAGSTITVGLATDTGNTTAPTCKADSGTTGESSNLSFVKAPASPADTEYPSILFTESNIAGAAASCDAIPGT